MTSTSPASAPAIPVAEGIYQVRIPLPFALNIVNCYLIDDGDGSWTVLDTGLNRPEARAAWADALGALGVEATQIQRIILTHMHPDHFGMAGWWQQIAAHGDHVPPVQMSQIEYDAALRTWMHRAQDHMQDHMIRCGVPDEHIPSIVAIGHETALETRPHPTKFEILAPGQSLTLGGRQFTAIHAPGHCDGQLIFYCADEKLMLSGDHVLMKITPNVGTWHDTQPSPLRRFLTSLRELRALDVTLALPGHKTLIHDWRGRIDELLAHHDHRLALTLDTARGGATVYETGLVLFQMERFTPHELRFAMAEALSHLDYLVEEGALRREIVGKAWRFSAK